MKFQPIKAPKPKPIRVETAPKSSMVAKTKKEGLVAHEKGKLNNLIMAELNNFPGLHPAAHTFFKNASLAILNKVHLAFLAMDKVTMSKEEKENRLKSILEKGIYINEQPRRAQKKLKPQLKPKPKPQPQNNPEEYDEISIS